MTMSFRNPLNAFLFTSFIDPPNRLASVPSGAHGRHWTLRVGEAVRSFARAPPLQHRRQLGLNEFEELERLGDSRSGRGRASDHLYTFTQAPFASFEHLVLAGHRLVPDLALHSVAFATRSRIDFAAAQIDLNQ